MFDTSINYNFHMFNRCIRVYVSLLEGDICINLSPNGKNDENLFGDVFSWNLKLATAFHSTSAHGGPSQKKG